MTTHFFSLFPVDKVLVQYLDDGVERWLKQHQVRACSLSGNDIHVEQTTENSTPSNGDVMNNSFAPAGGSGGIVVSESHINSPAPPGGSDGAVVSESHINSPVPPGSSDGVVVFESHINSPVPPGDSDGIVVSESHINSAAPRSSDQLVIVDHLTGNGECGAFAFYSCQFNCPEVPQV